MQIEFAIRTYTISDSKQKQFTESYERHYNHHLNQFKVMENKFRKVQRAAHVADDDIKSVMDGICKQLMTEIR
jgi:hypothetical protein